MDKFKTFAHLISPRKMLNGVKKRAQRAGIPFELTVEDIIFLMNRANGQCEVSGVPFSMGRIQSSSKRPFAPSIDRAAATEGYSRANCRIVCVCVNFAMNEWGDKIIKAITSRDSATVPTIAEKGIDGNKAIAALQKIDEIISNNASASHAKVGAVKRVLKAVF